MLLKTQHFLLSLLLFFISSMSCAEALRMGVEKIDYYPYYAVKKAKFEGFARDLFDLFSQSGGQELILQPTPVAKLTENFVAGKLDAKFPDNPAWAKDMKAGKAIVYSAPVVSYIDGFMVPADKLGKGVAALKAIGTIRGFTPFAVLDDIKSGKLQLKEFSHPDALMRALRAGEVDAIYFNIDVARQLPGNDNTIVFDSGLPHIADHYHVSAIDHPDFIQQFDAFLVSHAEQIAALKNKYQLK